jgi:hypothetical protein
MRKYKGLLIPDRKPRDSDDIITKQVIYCNKSDCSDMRGSCENCLFSIDNRDLFKQWYLNKNKKVGKK